MKGQTPGPGQPPQRAAADSRRWTWIALLALAGYLLWTGLIGQNPAREISYSAFREHLEKGEVSRVVLEEERIRGELTLPPESPSDEGEEPSDPAAGAPAAAPVEPETVLFQTVRVEDPELVADLTAAGVEYSGVRASAFTSFLFAWVLPMAVMLFVFLWLFRSVSGGAGARAMSFGKSRAKLVPETGTGVDFADVAGCDEAKESLREMVEFLKHPGRFTALGARIPKGVLLLGPPGTGKTLLARAVAGEAEVPFFSITGSDFVEMFVGVGAARVRDLFEQAQQRAPCIVFIDEIDAIGRQRGVSMGVVNDEREQTLNQLLSEMDGFEANSGVILIAATNRPEVLDRALLRPGRFDRQVVLDAPDRAGREAILRVHVRGKAVADDVDLSRIAQETPGMSGADLANALNEAALWAARNDHAKITHADIEEAIEQVLAGPERRSRRLGPEEKRRVAFHESGHAVVAAWCEHADPVKRISIVPRGRAALGYTMQLPEEERFLRTRSQLEDDLKVRLGGRAAEELVIGDVSTGAQDDLLTATAIARQMVCLFGMNERIGLAACARPEQGRFLGGGELVLQRDCSEATAREIDEEVKLLLDEALESAKSILATHRAQLDDVAGALLERETLDYAAFARIAGREAVPRDSDGSAAGALASGSTHHRQGTEA